MGKVLKTKILGRGVLRAGKVTIRVDQEFQI